MAKVERIIANILKQDKNNNDNNDNDNNKDNRYYGKESTQDIVEIERKQLNY